MYNNNCSLDLYSRDLRTTITPFLSNVPSHKTYWTFTELRVVCTHDWTSRVILTRDWLNSNWFPVACSVLPLISQDQESDECTCRIMFLHSRNIYKCKQAVYCVFCLRLSLQSCCCLFIYLSVILYCTLLLFVYFFFPPIFLNWCCFYNFAY